MRFRKMPPGLAAAYAPASAGPFQCGNCEYQKNLDCFKPEVIREFILLGNAKDGAKTVRVESGGCCAYQEKA